MSEIVTIKVVTGFNSDDASNEVMYVDGKRVFSTFPLYECPEDATLERDIVGAGEFASFMEKFLIVNKGKKVRFVYEEEEEEEE